MAAVAEFTIEADDFPLGKVFEDLPDVTIELERVVPTNNALVPYLWVREAKIDDIEGALNRHPELEEIELVDEVDREYLVKLTWNRDYQGVLKAITETDVTLLSGTGTEDNWALEIRGDDREAIAEFQHYCREHDVPMTLTSLHALSRMGSGTKYDLTDAQREALVLAYSYGYFRTPREAPLQEIAEELGITGQSLGSRLRRGTHRLIGSTLIEA